MRRQIEIDDTQIEKSEWIGLSLTPQTQAWHHRHKLQKCSEPCDTLFIKINTFCVASNQCLQEFKHTWYFQIQNFTPNNIPKKSKNAVITFNLEFSADRNILHQHCPWQISGIWVHWKLFKVFKVGQHFSWDITDDLEVSLTFLKGFVQSDRFDDLSFFLVFFLGKYNFPLLTLLWSFYFFGGLSLRWKLSEAEPSSEK